MLARADPIVDVGAPGDELVVDRGRVDGDGWAIRTWTAYRGGRLSATM